MTKFRENKDVRRPFLSTPEPQAYFPAAAIEKARRATARCLRRDEGVALVVGSTGVGKTLLARVLASDFDDDNLVAFVSPTRRLDVKSFLQQFLYGLRQTFCGCDETEMRLMALDYLEHSPQERCLLFVDDAHNLASRVFDEIRGLIDQCAASTTRLSVALFGAGALEERLNLPALFPFQQRIVSRAYLEPFSRAEIGKYVERELKRADANARFSKEAIEEIARLSEGSPRVVNQLCDRAFFLACGGEEGDVDEANASKKRRTERVQIDGKDVERAWARLLCLPEEEENACDVAREGESASVVEFGFLDDDENDEYNNKRESASVQTRAANETVALSAATAPDLKSAEPEVAPPTIEAAANAPKEQGEARGETNAEVEASAPPAPKPIDWEAERYGSHEEEAPSALESDKNDAESDDEEEDETNVGDDFNLRFVPKLSAVDANAQDDASEAARSSTQESRASEADVENGDAQERRVLAKRAFWETEDASDLTESLARLQALNASLDAELRDDEEENENEESDDENEIDYDLDARLREKFGANDGDADDLDEEIDDESDEESDEEREPGADAALLPPEIEREGMRFEPRGGAEFVELDAATFATSGTQNGANDAKTLDDETKDESFDGALELAPRDAAKFAPKAKTRRPIQSNDDGSREFFEVNGFEASDAAKLAADDRFLESQFAALPKESTARAWSENATENDDEDDDEDDATEARAYRQIVASCYRSVAEFPASEQYLNELRLLEQEIAEEANLIRRIRNIHLRLRSVRAPNALDQVGSEADSSESANVYVAK